MRKMFDADIQIDKFMFRNRMYLINFFLVCHLTDNEIRISKIFKLAISLKKKNRKKKKLKNKIKEHRKKIEEHRKIENNHRKQSSKKIIKKNQRT
jgi:uncharacterized protein YlxW (UPF0749 family)